MRRQGKAEDGVAKRLKQQVIKIKNYGDDRLNRLAVVADTFEKMEPRERAAVFRWLISLYPNESHQEHP